MLGTKMHPMFDKLTVRMEAMEISLLRIKQGCSL